MKLTGTIVGIYISPSGYNPETKTNTPMIALTEVMARINGLESTDGKIIDRYHLENNTGFYVARGKPKKRAFTMMAIEAIDDTLWTPEKTRRNFIVRGIAPKDMGKLVNVTFEPGEAKFKGFDECTPCDIPHLSLGPRGLELPKFTKEFPGVLGGLRGEVLKEGVIRIGDTFTAEVGD